MFPLRIAVVALFLSIVHAPGSFGDQARIDEIVATPSGGSISVNLELASAFEESWRLEALQSGLPLVFVYQIELIRKRENWFDSRIGSSEIEIVATYNSLTREYLLNYRKDRKLVSSRNVRSIDELKRKMASIAEERLFPLEDRNPRRLRVRARAILGRRYVFYVIPRPVATDWETVRVQESSAP